MEILLGEVVVIDGARLDLWTGGCSKRLFLYFLLALKEHISDSLLMITNLACN